MTDEEQTAVLRRISRVLIANRGEIAVRVARTCQAMGISVVAVYSTADERALHVLVADDAVCIGPPPATESYLSIEAMLAAACKSGADAIHPGYGFLAENARFAAAVEEAGLIWIGPPPSVIALMGDKVAAKDLARRSGLPTVPGYMGEDQRAEALLAAAEEMGYPVLLKASAGGGGKGMRTVPRREDLAEALEGARREARSAFGDDRIFLEKLLLRPRHVEVQVLMDAHGHGVHLGDRDCSLQRRHQKVIEEAPAPGLPPQLHESMGADAVRLAQAAGYVNAGTVEYLYDGKEYYFLEMNTRIQVEHPVTEMVTGLDLVRLQLQIASGAELPLTQTEVEIKGHSIEARIYAEDPANGFLPSTGIVTVFDPPEWPGVRNDAGVYPRAEVSPYYDPMLAKLVVRAESRDEAIDLLVSGLEEYAVEGPVTNLAFLQWVASAPEFLAGDVDIGFVEREWQPGLAAHLPPEVLAAAAAADLYGASDTVGPDLYSPWRALNMWRQNGIPRPLVYQHAGRPYTATATRDGESGWLVTVEDQELRVDSSPNSWPTVTLWTGDVSQQVDVTAMPDHIHVSWLNRFYVLRRGAYSTHDANARGARADGGPTAPMPGTVVKVAVDEGQRVTAHEALVVIEAMKMEHVIEAPHDGVVTAVLVKEGDLVPAGSPVVTLETE